MALILANGLRVTILGQWTNGRPIHSVFHFRMTAVTNRVPACAEAAAAVLQAWGTNVVPLIANNYSVASARFVDMSSDSGATGEVTAEPPYTGGNIATVNSPYTGLVMKKLYSGSFRGTRSGRTFFPGISDANVDEDGLVLNSVRDAARTAMVNFLQDCNATSTPNVVDMAMVVAHTPSQLVTQTKEVRIPLKNGVMTSHDVTDFVAAQLESGLKSRIATGG
jgi:hypothetical protein